MERNKSIESQIFEYNDWEQHDTMLFTFYDITLNIDLPGSTFKKGDRFAIVNVSYDNSIIEFYLDDTNDKPIIVYDIILSLKPQ